jgi:hypothetical protein
VVSENLVSFGLISIEGCPRLEKVDMFVDVELFFAARSNIEGSVSAAQAVNGLVNMIG